MSTKVLILNHKKINDLSQIDSSAIGIHMWNRNPADHTILIYTLNGLRTVTPTEGDCDKLQLQVDNIIKENSYTCFDQSIEDDNFTIHTMTDLMEKENWVNGK